METGRISDVNPFLVELLGFSRDEMIGKTVGELSPFKDVVSNQAILEQLQRNKYVRYHDLPLETRDGRKIAVEFVCNVYQAGDQKVIQCNIRDITEQRRAERAANWLAAIVDSSDDAIIGKDLNSIITHWNKGAEKIFGYTAAEMVGASIMRLIPADRRQEENQMLDKIKQGESVKHFETLRQAKDGRLIDVSVTASPIRNATGKVIGVSKMTHDITQRRQAERRLGMRNAVSRVLADATSLASATPGIIRAICEAELWDFGAIWEVDAASGLLCCRETWHRPGFKGETMAAETRALTLAAGLGLPGRVWATGEMQMVPDVALDAGYLRARIAISAGLRSAIAFPVFAGNAVTGVIDFAAREIRQPDGQLVEMFAAIGRQVGQFVERHRAEESLRKSEDQIRRFNVELEQRVVERTVQLEAANQELEAFSYSVSHDLRAPLRHITGFVSLLQQDSAPSLSEKSLRYLDTISSSTQRMGDLIDDLLDFSRIGRQALRKTEIPLGPLVKETLGDFQAESAKRIIVWKLHPLPVVRADRSLLRLVLVNLISNAVKFTGRREEAKIEIGTAPGGAAETVVFIRDNGAGFDPRYTDKLFGVFQRLHRQEEFAGTGIGLANVQRIIHRHGGRVWAEGVLDGGATFYFSIPKTNADLHGHPNS